MLFYDTIGYLGHVVGFVPHPKLHGYTVVLCSDGSYYSHHHAGNTNGYHILVCPD